MERRLIQRAFTDEDDLHELLFGSQFAGAIEICESAVRDGRRPGKSLRTSLLQSLLN